MVGADPGLDDDSRRVDLSARPVFFEIVFVNAKARRPSISLSILKGETLEPGGAQSPYPERGSGHQLLGGTAKSCGRAMAAGPGGN